jgi:hypothetical protein
MVNRNLPVNATRRIELGIEELQEVHIHCLAGAGCVHDDGGEQHVLPDLPVPGR